MFSILRFYWQYCFICRDNVRYIFLNISVTSVSYIIVVSIISVANNGFQGILIGCLTSKSEALLFTSWLFFSMATENRFVLVSFNGIEGILKDTAITQKCCKKVVKHFDNYNLLTICLTI